MPSVRERFNGSGASVTEVGHAEKVSDDQGGIDLDRGKRKAKIEFVQRDGRSITIPWIYEEGMDSEAPEYNRIELVFVRHLDTVTVTLHGPEGGSLEWLFKRLKSCHAGKIVERDGLRAQAAASGNDPNGDEFAVAEMTIEIEKRS